MLSNEVMHFEKGGKPMSHVPVGSTSVIQPGPNLVSFDVAYKQLMERWEDPHMTGKLTTDAGGKTKYGISESAYPSLDISTLTLSRAQEITHADYWMYSAWDISKLQDQYQPLANKLFQFGFNIGVGTVIQIANICVYVLDGGKGPLPKLGQPLNVIALMGRCCDDLLLMLHAAQMSRYIKDYHNLARVPHSLLDRALCIE